MKLEKGKLYQVKELHPKEVHEPLDCCFYPCDILSNRRQIKNLKDPYTGEWLDIHLKKGDMFLFLGNLNGVAAWSRDGEYTTILFGEKILSSNCNSVETCKYYEFEQVGHGI